MTNRRISVLLGAVALGMIMVPAGLSAGCASQNCSKRTVCKSSCDGPVRQSRGVYTPFGFFPAPPYKVFGNATPEKVPAEGRGGRVADCAAYEEYYGRPAPLTRAQVRRLRNDTWALHQEYRQARADIREAYGLNESPVMAGRRSTPDDATAPYAPSGPRAYAGTPVYSGPAYVSSFQVDAPAAWPSESARRITPPGSFTPRDVSHPIGHRVGADASPDLN